MGRLLEAQSHSPIPLSNDLQLQFRTLPAVATMATSVVQGALETIHAGYTEIGTWAEVNGYRLAGLPRELTLQSAQAAMARSAFEGSWNTWHLIRTFASFGSLVLISLACLSPNPDTRFTRANPGEKKPFESVVMHG